jgi:hypothetical protein
MTLKQIEGRKCCRGQSKGGEGKENMNVKLSLYITKVPRHEKAEEEWSASRPSSFTPGERAPGTHWMLDWLGPRADLYVVVERKYCNLSGNRAAILWSSSP